MEAFLKRLKFPDEGMLQDVLAKLTAESVTVQLLLSVDQSEFDEIGISGEALAIILAGAEVEKQQVQLDTAKCALLFFQIPFLISIDGKPADLHRASVW